MNESKYLIGDMVYTLKQKWVVDKTPHEVISVSSEESLEGMSYRYKVKRDDEKKLDRAEENLFETVKAAQKECDRRNRIKKNVRIEDIVITSAFSNTTPSITLFEKRLKEYKENQTFNTDIIVKNGCLVDGYSAYLVAKMLGLKELTAFVV